MLLYLLRYLALEIVDCTQALECSIPQLKAPKIFAKTDSRGGLVYALIATATIGAAYFWLINASVLAEFIIWAGIAWSHYKFRKAYIAQGKDINDLPFKAKWYLLEPILALIMCIIVIIGQNYEALIQGRDFITLLTSYIGLWLFLLIWAGYKLITKSKAIDQLQADIKRYNY